MEFESTSEKPLNGAQLTDEGDNFLAGCGEWDYSDLESTENGEFLVPGSFKEISFSKTMIFKSGFKGQNSEPDLQPCSHQD